MKRILKIFLLLLISTAVPFLLWGKEYKDVYKAVADGNGVQKVEMVGGDFYFKPNHVIVKVNVPVSISIKEEPGFVSHSIVLHAPGSGMDFDVELETTSKTITFTPTKAGKYPFYCDKGLLETHRSKGMEGVLEVTQ